MATHLLTLDTGLEGLPIAQPLGQPGLSQRHRTALRVIQTAMARELTPRQRQCVQLCLLRGLTQAQAAQALGIGKGTVCRHLQKARQVFSRAVEYAGLAPPLQPGGKPGIIGKKGRCAKMGWAKEWDSRLQAVRMFVLDMDGTIYLGDRLFPYTQGFLQKVRETGRDFCFFTNNSSRNREAYLEKLARMGIQVAPEQMLLSNGVLLQWLQKHHPGASCYVVGTPALREDFRRAGFVPDDPQAQVVVLGFDTTLTYEKLRIACDLIRAGRPVYGVNPDWNCPVEGGFIPDCGSIAALVKASTGVQCEFFGKPSPHTLSYLLEKTGCAPQELAVVGDRLYTDIAVTQGSQAMGILVMSGETTPQLLAQSPTVPDLVVENLEELARLL